MIIQFQLFPRLLAITAICCLLLPTMTFATNNSGGDDTPEPNGFTISGPFLGVFGDNGWYTTRPTYNIRWHCGGTLDGPWSPDDEGNHSYDWGQKLGSTGGGYYLRKDGGSWVFQGGVGCESGDNEITLVKSIPNLKIDTVPPKLIINTPYEGEPLQHNQVAITGNVSDQSSGVTSLTMDGVSMSVSENGDFSTSLTKDPGVYTVTFVAKDIAGKTTQVARTFKILEEAASNAATNIAQQSAPTASTSAPHTITPSQVSVAQTPSSNEVSAIAEDSTSTEIPNIASNIPGDSLVGSQATNPGSVRGAQEERSFPVAETAAAVSSFGGLGFFLVRKFLLKL